MSLISKTFEASDEIQDSRTRFRILAHCIEELGEMSEELVIDKGLSYKSPGKDGVIGEGVDLILCVLDLIHKTDPTVTEEDLEAIAVKKIAKWKGNAKC